MRKPNKNKHYQAHMLSIYRQLKMMIDHWRQKQNKTTQHSAIQQHTQNIIIIMYNTCTHLFLLPRGGFSAVSTRSASPGLNVTPFREALVRLALLALYVTVFA